MGGLPKGAPNGKRHIQKNSKDREGESVSYMGSSYMEREHS